MRILLVHNPKAGFDQPDTAELLAILEAAGHSATYQSSRIDDLACALKDSWDLVVAAGGDGLVTNVLKHCADRALPVALLPVGTANNMAISLGHSGAIEDLIRAWRLDALRPLDLGAVAGDFGRSRFAESFGVGLLAETVVGTRATSATKQTSFDDAVDKLNDNRKSLRKILRDLEPDSMTIELDGEPLSGEFLWVEALTIGHAGPRLTLVENADPSDGLLDIVMLPVDERDAFLEYLDRTRAGSASTRTGLLSRRAASIKLTWRHLAAHIDGAAVPTPPGAEDQRRSADIAVLPGAVQVLRLGA